MDIEAKKQQAYEDQPKDYVNKTASGFAECEDKEAEAAQDEKVNLKCVRSRLLSCKTWLRILFIVFFLALYYLANFIAGAVVVLQTLFVLFTGERNKPIAEFASGLALYIYEVAQYLCYSRDDKPFPFESWPKGESTEADELKTH